MARLYGKVGEFFGKAKKEGSPTHHKVVDDVLKDTPPDPAVEGQWGRCGELDAIDQALRSYEKQTGNLVTTLEQAREILKGSKMQTANVRGLKPESDVHGRPKAPCKVCNPVLKQFGIEYVK